MNRVQADERRRRADLLWLACCLVLGLATACNGGERDETPLERTVRSVSERPIAESPNPQGGTLHYVDRVPHAGPDGRVDDWAAKIGRWHSAIWLPAPWQGWGTPASFHFDHPGVCTFDGSTPCTPRNQANDCAAGDGTTTCDSRLRVFIYQNWFDIGRHVKADGSRSPAMAASTHYERVLTGVGERAFFHTRDGLRVADYGTHYDGRLGGRRGRTDCNVERPAGTYRFCSDHPAQSCATDADCTGEFDPARCTGAGRPNRCCTGRGKGKECGEECRELTLPGPCATVLGSQCENDASLACESDADCAAVGGPCLGICSDDGRTRCREDAECAGGRCARLPGGGELNPEVCNCRFMVDLTDEGVLDYVSATVRDLANGGEEEDWSEGSYLGECAVGYCSGATGTACARDADCPGRQRCLAGVYPAQVDAPTTPDCRGDEDCGPDGECVGLGGGGEGFDAFFFDNTDARGLEYGPGKVGVAGTFSGTIWDYASVVATECQSDADCPSDTRCCLDQADCPTGRAGHCSGAMTDAESRRMKRRALERFREAARSVDPEAIVVFNGCITDPDDVEDSLWVAQGADGCLTESWVVWDSCRPRFNDGQRLAGQWERHVELLERLSLDGKWLIPLVGSRCAGRSQWDPAQLRRLGAASVLLACNRRHLNLCSVGPWTASGHAAEEGRFAEHYPDHAINLGVPLDNRTCSHDDAIECWSDEECGAGNRCEGRSWDWTPERLAVRRWSDGIVIVNPNGGKAGEAPPRYALPPGERFVDADGSSWSGTIDVPPATGVILRRE